MIEVISQISLRLLHHHKPFSLPSILSFSQKVYHYLYTFFFPQNVGFSPWLTFIVLIFLQWLMILGDWLDCLLSDFQDMSLLYAFSTII